VKKAESANNAQYSSIKLQNLLDQFIGGSAGSSTGTSRSIGDVPGRLTDNDPHRLTGSAGRWPGI